MSNSLRPHGLSHTRLPCPSLSPGVCSNSSSLSWLLFSYLILCYPLLLLPSVFSTSGSFPASWLFASSGQSIGTTASALPMNSQDWFYLGLTGLISLLFKGLSKVFFSTTIRKHQFFGAQPSLSRLLHPYVTTGKTIDLTIQTFVSKVMSLLFNMLSKFVIALLLRSKCLLISWLQVLSSVILEPKKIKSPS